MGLVRLLGRAGAVALAIGLLVPVAVAVAAESCSTAQLISGTCNVTGDTDGNDVTLTGTGSSPGSGSGSDSDPDGDSPDEPYCFGMPNGQCLPAHPGTGSPTPPVTLADIAHFRPNPGRDVMQPDGWMIVGLHTNFYSTGGTQIHEGELFDARASVRFTPVAWHWAYGDGSTAVRSTPGRTWASGGIAEFDPTPTSHIFRTSGNYTITLTIDFAAEYRVAGRPWTPIVGILSVPANPLTAVAGTAKTVLVERGCRNNPAGPGC